MQTVKNALYYLLNTCIDKLIVCPHYDRLVERYFGADLKFYHLLPGVDIWLTRVDFVFEFPRPTMQNVYIGGFQCKPSAQLSSELEDFVQSSGEHWFILMSLGTLVKGLPLEITSEIAIAFAQIPHKVIWRYASERPKNFGNNTFLVKWVPQKDLLGHPKIRAFVAHGGTNEIYESIYHGVPIIGKPLLFDQFENTLRSEVQEAAKVVDPTKIHNPYHRNDMKRLSARVHHETQRSLTFSSPIGCPGIPIIPVDVICFLIAALLMLTAVLLELVKFLYFRWHRNKKTKQE